MIIETPEQLEFAREKLAMLEARCGELQACQPLSLTKSLSLRSLTNLANQLKEQITRYQSRRASPSPGSTTIRGIQNVEQWQNTRAKLEMFEKRCGEICVTGDMTLAEQLSWQSLKRTVNQLTEELVRYSARHPDEVGVFKIQPPRDWRGTGISGGQRAGAFPNA